MRAVTAVWNVSSVGGDFIVLPRLKCLDELLDAPDRITYAID